jgi:colanic acid/amylovoran biosynthesis protein WcaK/AmsJ
VFSPLIAAPSLYEGFAMKVCRSLQATFDWPRQKRLIDKIRASDLVISSGGGYFYSHRKQFPGPMFFQNYLPLRIAVAFKKPVILLPQSIGPLLNPIAGRMLKNVLINPFVKNIYARETASLDYLKALLPKSQEAKLDFCPDMALCLREDLKSEPPALSLNLPGPVAALTVRNWDFPEVNSAREKKARQERYLGAVIQASLEFQRKWGGSVVVVPQVRGPGVFENDEIPSRRVWAELKARLPQGHLAYVQLPPTASPWTLVEIYARSDLVLATRFHSALFGLLSGTPVISLDYQAKSRSTMEWLELGGWSLSVSTLRPEALLHLADRIIEDGGGLKKTIRRQTALAQTVIEEKLGALWDGLRGFPSA